MYTACSSLAVLVCPSKKEAFSERVPLWSFALGTEGDFVASKLCAWRNDQVNMWIFQLPADFDPTHDEEIIATWCLQNP